MNVSFEIHAHTDLSQVRGRIARGQPLLERTLVSMVNVWVIRAGKYSERAEWAIEKNYSGGGWHEVGPELLNCISKEEVAQLVDVIFADKPKTKPSATGQLWSLQGRMQIGDLVVMPIRTTRELAFGWIQSDLLFLENDDDHEKRLVRKVDWVNRLPRDAAKQDLLYTLGATLAIFSPSRNHAAERLLAMVQTGIDPGIPNAVLTSASSPASMLASEEEVTAELVPNVEELAMDQISKLIAQEFTGHGLADLVTQILIAEGLHAVSSPEGADGGIDIIAGKGALGLESPKILVQVKSPCVDRPVVQQLTGLVSSHGADFGLIVAWGGMTSAAKQEIQSKRFTIKAWQATDILEAVLRNYDKLPGSIKQALPLKQIWIPIEDNAAE